MNFLAFIFSILLILTFGNLAIREKQMGARRMKTTYLGHIHAGRKILSTCERETYNSFDAMPKPKSLHPKKKAASAPSQKPPKPMPNAICARLNLQPLIDQGRENHRFLYDLTAKMLRTFYEPLFEEKGNKSEYTFLDAWVKAARSLRAQETQFAYEKIVFKNPEYQALYYKMLKGTKKWDLEKKLGYPPLLDYIQFDLNATKICVAHTHPDLLSVFFNGRAAAKLYGEIHRQKPPLLTKELLERICLENSAIRVEPELYALIHVGAASHKAKLGSALIAEDAETHITLKKNVHLSQL